MEAAPNDTLRSLVADALDLDDAEELSMDSDNKSIAKWDSMAQVIMALSLESEFGVSLSTDEISQLTSMHRIVETLSRHGVQQVA